MALENISAANNPATATLSSKSTAGSNDNAGTLALDESTFLKLLLAQLKNQDPTNPTDPTAWTQQVASLSQVEQQTNTNKKLDQLVALQNGTALGAQLSSATNYIGKVVQVKGDTATVGSSGDIKFSYDVPAGVSNTTITISDSTGKAIGSFAGKVTEGKQNVIWDAKNTSGTRVASGNYKISVSTTDANNTSKAATTYVYDPVNSVQVDSGKMNIVLDQGQIVSVNDVISVE